jgi:hypothetical protein
LAGHTHVGVGVRVLRPNPELRRASGIFGRAAGQYLKEGTQTFDYRPTDGLLIRRDESNQRYFTGNTLGFLEAAQPTTGIGLVWWFGQKEGVW